MLKKIRYNIICFIAILLEWINVVLFLAAMGYDIDILSRLRDIYYISEIYYFCASLDIILFGILTLINKKKKNDKEMLVYTYCCLVQIVLLIFKVKI